MDQWRIYNQLIGWMGNVLSFALLFYWVHEIIFSKTLNYYTIRINKTYVLSIQLVVNQKPHYSLFTNNNIMQLKKPKKNDTLVWL